MDGSCISNISGQCFSVDIRLFFSLLTHTIFPAYLDQIAEFAPAGLGHILGSHWGEGCLEVQFNECPAFFLYWNHMGSKLEEAERHHHFLFKGRNFFFFVLNALV